MRTYLDFESKKWVSEKPKKYWTGLVCELTGEKIFTGDTVSILFLNRMETHTIKDFYQNPNSFQREYLPILISHNET
jgi:hypothetical protein